MLVWGSVLVQAQSTEKKVIITGVRFAYPLVEQWIAEYKAANPDVTVQIEPRSTTDPSKYDLLIEAYEPDGTLKDTREFVNIARYALLPVANAQSAFARIFSEKGLTQPLIRQLYFNDVTASKKDREEIKVPFTVYTRLQKAGAPITFAHYFGFEQANIVGKAIAGADEHLIKALLKDTTAVSYSVPGLLFDVKTRQTLKGLAVLPVDTDNDGKVEKEEKILGNLDELLARIEDTTPKNIPVESIHLSIAKNSQNAEALRFLKWVLSHDQATLHTHGFLKPEPQRFQRDKQKFDVAAN
jgi:ABC-type phosphate transport system substrate-binding protein